MASVITETTKSGRKRYRVAFRDEHGTRKAVRLSGVSKKDAGEICSKVQAIVSARISGAPLANSVADWLSNAGDELHGKLAAAGLCDERKAATLGDWLDRYIATRRAKVADSTVASWLAARRRLTEYLGENRDLRSIAPADAAAWQEQLQGRYARATIANVTKKAKQFFADAADTGYVDASPFTKLVAGSMANDDRNVYVPAADVLRIIDDHAPNAEWRLLIALGRFGGLRVPSEALLLRWEDIDWQAGTMRVTSPKTVRHGKGYRVVPLFSELRRYLEEAFDPTEERCIPSYSGRGCNLRTSLLKLIEKAKLKPWPRPWHNLRASRQTDLAALYPLHTVTAWLGNTPSVATEHYLSVLPEHMAAAVAGPEPKPQGGDAGGGAQGGGDRRNAAPTDGTTPTKNPEKTSVSRGLGRCVSAPSRTRT